MNYNELLVEEVQKRYLDYRFAGISREETINRLKSDYASELLDSDDIPNIAAGMTLALCKKHELTNDFATELQRWIECTSTATEPKMQRILQLLSDTCMYGKEASYRHKKEFFPDWKTGDLFSHVLTHPSAEKLGFFNWVILFYKVGEYTDQDLIRRHLMYITLCPPKKVPQTAEELQSLNFLRMMCHGSLWDYWGQITVKSQKELLGFELTWLGNFPGILPPQDQATEDPLVAMPLFGSTKRDPQHPGYEDQICRLIKSYRQESRFS